jgi:hypothetical protein
VEGGHTINGISTMRNATIRVRYEECNKEDENGGDRRRVDLAIEFIAAVGGF